MPATVTPLFVPRSVEVDLRCHIAELERDKAELVQRWLRANDTCRRQRLLLRTLAVFTAREVVLPTWCLWTIGFLFGLAASVLLWP